MTLLVFVTGLLLGLGIPAISWGEEPPSTRQRMEQTATGCSENEDILDSVQIETSDLKSFEAFFGDVLRAPLVERRDHPDKDSARGYCYLGVRIIVRRDHAVPRPTGWVQINFTVPDVGEVQRELETALKNLPVDSLTELERDKIVRVHLKPNVRRGDRRAIRLEVSGPEGFMIGFNQYKKEPRQ